jgi:hypothetical protein
MPVRPVNRCARRCRWRRYASAVLIPALALAWAADAGRAELLRLPVSRDTWVSSYRGERDCNLGGSARLKTKGIQEFALVDLDVTPLRGRTIRSATLHLRQVGDQPQRRLTVSSVAGRWVEGTSRRYRPQEGSASFRWAAQGDRRWAGPGSDLTAAFGGVGHTVWASHPVQGPGKDGWMSVAVAPRVVAARVAGISQGFVVFDDIGSEYERDGNRFTWHVFPNRYVASREYGEGWQPYWRIEAGPADRLPPAVIERVESTHAGLPAGEARVRWATPGDRGPAGVIGFMVRWSTAHDLAWDQARPVPRHLIPMAGRVGQPVTMHLRDLPVEGVDRLTLAIRAVDAAGNVGPMRTAAVPLSRAEPVRISPSSARPRGGRRTARPTTCSAAPRTSSDCTRPATSSWPFNCCSRVGPGASTCRWRLPTARLALRQQVRVRCAG